MLLTGCAATDATPSAAVSADEAEATFVELVALADERTLEAASTVCDRHSCIGLSSGALFTLQSHPGPDRPPRQLCSVQLPALEQQLGSRLLVVEGVDSRDRPYVSQVLVERLDDRLVVHEPAYWLGVHYTALRSGASEWSGASDEPTTRAAQLERAKEPCSEPERWLDEVTAG